MKKLTMKQAEKLHKELWGWLAETGKHKGEWPKWEWNGGQIKKNRFLCFPCVISKHGEGGHRGCNECPVKWDGSFCLEGEYGKWSEAMTTKSRKKYAAIIRDLPWRKK